MGQDEIRQLARKPAGWLYGLAILALTAASACGRSPLVGAAGVPTGTDTRSDSGVRDVDSFSEGGAAADGAGARTGTSVFTQISAGGISTCGLRADGAVTCWGDNSYGESAPAPGAFTQISAGGIHACGLRADGTAACWGDNSSGQSNPAPGPFTRISAGGNFTCGPRRPRSG